MSEARLVTVSSVLASSVADTEGFQYLVRGKRFRWVDAGAFSALVRSEEEYMTFINACPGEIPGGRSHRSFRARCRPLLSGLVLVRDAKT